MSQDTSIRIKKDTCNFLKACLKLSGCKTYDQLFRLGGGVLYNWSKDQFSRNQWLRICQEENNLSKYGATE